MLHKHSQKCGTKVEGNGRYPNKIESEANSETFAGTAKCILNIARHYMPE